jgi:protein-S-isoprenylcysteine O-methyltransferase Ste14
MALKVGYGLLFCAVLPALLFLWARGAAEVVRLPAYGSVELGAGIAAAGVVLLGPGMAALWRRGGGLPMNAFPPPRLVTSGIYGLFPHPIYTGFTLACFGFSMAGRSAAGLWLVSPVTALGCAALVYGYEKPDLARRFGGEALKAIRILPPDTRDRPRFPDALRFWLFVLVPWLAIYEIVGSLGVAPLSRDTRLAPIYASVYFAAILAPILIRTRGRLRALMIRSWLAMAIIFPIYLCLPALPSFQVIWAILAACALLIRSDRAWERLRGATERLANSWHEWRAGPFRFINHGLYAGAGTFASVAIVSSLSGHLLSVAAIALGGLLGAGLWAQWVEGSPRLLRPFGFYGGLLGVILVACLMPESWLLLAACSVAGPWLQAIGRLRCLVQGCCHGRPADPTVGIRYCDPHSRVTRVPGLAGVPIHPTPLYSILGNGFAALVLARLWNVGAPLHLIGGVYLILNGIARFVEEAYRGEPQTPAFAGLRLYQWLSVLSVIAGAAITAIARTGPPPMPRFTATSFVVAAIFGTISALALGADFPESTKRFGRLT